MWTFVFFTNFVVQNLYRMSTIDIVIIAVIVIAAIYGYYKGIFAQMGALAGIIGGVICCRIFGDDLATFFNNHFADSTATPATTMFLNNVVAHVVIFVVAYFGARLLASLLSATLKKIKLGILNRIAGAVFAPVQWLVILSIILNIWIAIFPNSKIVKSPTGIADETIINLAPDILGSQTARFLQDAANNLND